MRSQTLYSSAQALLALAGTADAGTLYWAHRSGVDLPCTSGDGCDLVNASHWSHIGNVPITLLGLAAYISLLFASTLKPTVSSDSIARNLQAFILVVSFFGTIYSWYLQYVADVFIGAFCIYCRCSAIFLTLLLLTAIIERIGIIKAAKAPNS